MVPSETKASMMKVWSRSIFMRKEVFVLIV